MHLADFLWSLLVIYCMVIYFIFLFRVVVDIFRNHEMGGFIKAVWIFFLFFFPFLSLLIYVIVNGKGMAERDMAQMKQVKQAQDEYIRDVAGGSSATEQIEKAHALLNSGAITQAEFDAIKAKALA